MVTVQLEDELEIANEDCKGMASETNVCATPRAEAASKFAY